jgi:regulator of chromosome condensation
LTYLTESHCYILFTGKVYSWGFGQNLQLGTGNEDDALEPVEITGKQLEGHKVIAVASGGQHTMLITKPE